jgi:hypothetical protein
MADGERPLKMRRTASGSAGSGELSSPSSARANRQQQQALSNHPGGTAQQQQQHASVDPATLERAIPLREGRQRLPLASVVQIFTTIALPDYSLPWQVCPQVSSSGSGFAFVDAATKRRLILTNAHVCTFPSPPPATCAWCTCCCLAAVRALGVCWALFVSAPPHPSPPLALCAPLRCQHRRNDGCDDGTQVAGGKTAVLRVQLHGSPDKVRARALAIGHDCDLAILELTAPEAEAEAFWRSVEPVDFAAELPQLYEEVHVVRATLHLPGPE